MRYVFFTLIAVISLSSCVRKFDCKCTYLGTMDNKEETTQVKAKSISDAQDECDSFAGKYALSSYSGTCTIE